MKTQQELPSAKFNAYHTILQLARKHKGESLCQKAEDLYKQAIIIARTTQDFKPAILMEALYELASYYSFQGKDDQARPLWAEIKTYGEIYFKSGNPIYVQAISSLALLDENQGNTDKSEALYKELLQKQEMEFGDESLEICPALDQLAALYCRQQQYALAETIYLRILVIKEFHLGTCSVEINYTVNSLIDIFQKLGKWRLAEYMLNRQRAILVALHGEESLCVASCALRLALLQEAHTRQIDTAIKNLTFVVDIYTKRFGDQAGPIALLQKKLDLMLLSRLENQAIAELATESDDIITIEIDSKNETENKSQKSMVKNTNYISKENTISNMSFLVRA